MERFLRPERLDVDPNSANATKNWKHWKATFENFLNSFATPPTDKLSVLINYVSPNVFEIIAECEDYDAAIKTLKETYEKPVNEIFARHLLATYRQEPSQSLDDFLQKLKSLAKDCDFKAVTAIQHRDEQIRDAFISGLQSQMIRQRLLEMKSLDLSTAFSNARSLEMAEKQSHIYQPSSVPTSASTAVKKVESSPEDDESLLAATASRQKCFFCGYQRHPRAKCPAREETCKLCNKKGHFAKVCNSGRKSDLVAATHSLPLYTIITAASPSLTAAAPASLSKAIINTTVNGLPCKALIDTGSSESYIAENKVKTLKLPIHSSKKTISMASVDLSSTTKGHCLVSLQHQDQTYNNFRLSVLPGLCTDLILGHDFLDQHQGLQMPFRGKKPIFSVCGLTAANVDPPALFENLTPDCRPIATKSRRFTKPDEKFIDSEIQRLLSEGIIETSTSPWRAQVLVTSNERQKKRLVVDYSQTINRFTQLDAYPLPRIDQMIEKISEYKHFSTLDLRSAYHQIPIKPEERMYTAFEAGGKLYQFNRIPFGVTNGVSGFQRIIDRIIEEEEGVEDTFAYLDNVTICGKTTEEHDRNLQGFLDCARKYNLTFNESKNIISVQKISILGYSVSHKNIKPDPERLKPLKELDDPHDIKSQSRVVGMFAYYSQWISHFSDKIKPLVENTTFPLPQEVQRTFQALKAEIEKAVLVTVDDKSPLVVETDASDIAIAATLNQNGRPVAFFSRALSPSEKNHSSVEKEAYAIVEALRKWRHYLIGRHFRLVTDQKSVSFMFDNSSKKSKIKNDKIQRWKIELSCYSYDVVYRPGGENHAADALSRAFCSAACSDNIETLKALHSNLCHPGVARMFHFTSSRNLPYSMEQVKQVVSSCRVCAEMKPSFHQPQNYNLIKATQPFERLSVDFKGPLPSNTTNKYILTIIDEYSRFPFAFACPDMSSATLIKCFTQLFSLFGMPAYIHSDRGTSFMSQDFKTFLHEKGVATSRTTPYNPRGNGQVERLNGTLWKTINMALKSHSLDVSNWEHFLPQALHSIRSLLCTATNSTPHERMFAFNRRSTTGTTLPTWLTKAGTVLMRRNVRQSKYDPLVEEVELLECNPQYAHVRHANGRESTVAIRHLAPPGTAVQTHEECHRETAETELPTSAPDASPEPIIEVRDHDVEDTTNSYYDHLQKQQRVHSYNLRSRNV